MCSISFKWVAPAAIAIFLLAHTDAIASEPECTVTVAESAEGPGSVDVAYRVAWSGPADAWLVAPPSLPVVGGLDWSHANALATAGSDEASIVYHTRVAGDPGEYTLPSISIEVNGDGEPQLIEADAVNVSIPAAATAPNPMIFGAAVAVAFVVALGLFVMSRKSKVSTVNATVDGESSDVDEEDLMAIASKRRIEGDAYGFYRALAEAARSDAGLVERLQRSAEDAGFRGIEFTADQMDQDYRAAERIVAGLDKENEE